MAVEWLLFLALLVLGAACFFRHRLFAVVFLAVAAVAAGAKWTTWQRQRVAEFKEQRQALPREGRPGGYVSSDTCQSCHPSQHASWHRSFHRTMTQYPSAQSVKGDFNGVTLELAGETYQLAQSGDEFWVEMLNPDLKLVPPQQRAHLKAERVWRRLGVVTGSHHMQAYWVPSEKGNLQLNLPFTYLFDDQRWVPRNDAFLMDPKSPVLVQMWNANCIGCHATAGQPRPQPDNPYLVDTQAGELGIACEACHGPAEKHVAAAQSPAWRYTMHHDSKADRLIVNPAKLDHQASSQVCGQCHSITYLRPGHPWRYEGFTYRPGDDLNQHVPVVQPRVHAKEAWFQENLRRDPSYLADRYWPDGLVRLSGRDFSAMIDSPCYERGQLSCLSCHSMHESEPANQLTAGMETNRGCLQCHDRLDVPKHTHHAADSSGSLCYNCHMPRTTYGLMRTIRSHTITSPSAQNTLETGRPNACNLCHLDRTLAWTARTLNEWYQQPPPALTRDDETIPAMALWALRGDAGQRALAAWHMGWEPARKVSGDGWLAPYLAQLLEDPYSTVRYIAGHSLQRVRGFESFSYDYIAAPATRAAAHRRAFELWSQSPARDTRPEVRLDPATWARILSERNDRSMYLKE